MLDCSRALHVVLRTYVQDHIDSVSIIRNYLATDSITRPQEDAVLRAAVQDSLSLFGEPIKAYLLIKIGLIDEDGNSVSDGGILDYDRIVEQLTVIFGENGSRPILRHLDKKIEEQRASHTAAN